MYISIYKYSYICEYNIDFDIEMSIIGMPISSSL